MRASPPPTVARHAAKTAGLFETGPFGGAMSRLPGVGNDDRALVRRAIVLALIAWVPLVVLSLIHDCR
jgi:hypothetical protein